MYTDQVAALCQRADELLATEPPGAALAAWMRELAEFGATKQNLTSALAADYDKDAPVFSACRDDLLAAAAALLTRRPAGGRGQARRPAARPAAPVPRPGRGDRGRRDADQAERLLSLMLGGLLTDPAGGSRTG